MFFIIKRFVFRDFGKNESFFYYDDLFSKMIKYVFIITDIGFFVFWYSFQCLHIRGRFRNGSKATSTNYFMPTYPSFPFFWYYTFDIEDGKDATKHGESLGGGDFFIYNLLLLWLLPPLSSITIQFCILLGFTINIQISLWLTAWTGSIWKENPMPALPLPLILICTYAMIVDFIV